MENSFLMISFSTRMIKTSRVFHCFGLLQLFILFCHICGICENLPSVQHSANNATEDGPFEDGTTVDFTCQPFYRGLGNRIYTCRNGSWVGDYKCFKMCEVIRELENGKIVGNPLYVGGSRINFTCDSGYKLEGSSSLLCRSDGKWRPSTVPTCKPVNCGDLGNINDAHVFQASGDGTLNDFGSVVTITCKAGYMIQGSNSVTCNADGRWGVKPDCVKSSCGVHPATKTKCVEKSDFSVDGSMLTLLCKETSASLSVTKVGMGTAICIDNQWDELNMGCFCDCKVTTDGIQVDNLQPNDFLKHGDVLKWSCSFSFLFKKNDTSDIKCEDGEMRQPSCVIKWWILLILGLIVVAIILISVLAKYFVKRFLSNKKSDKRSHEAVPLSSNNAEGEGV